MLELSLRQRILAYLQKNSGQWIAKGHICDLARDKTGATGEHTGRRLRELAEEGTIEVKLVKGHAYYRFNELQRVSS